MAPNPRPIWNWHDDRQRASSRLQKFGGGEWFSMIGKPADAMEWILDVRTEHNMGSKSMGEIAFRGSLDGVLTLRIL